MDNSLWKITGLILAAVLLFITPVLNMLERQDDITYNIVYTETNNFVDIIRDTARITPSTYMNFVKRINATGNLYDISIEHMSKDVTPDYNNPLDYTSFNNNYEISYIGTYTQDILDILFPENTMQINDKSRYYYLKTGDFIAIEVRIKNKTLAQAMKAMFSMTTNDFPIIYVRAGGMIRDEAN